MIIICVMVLLNSFSLVEKFVEVNTVKQSENKYLCPLSGKKFKGIEFVRKHQQTLGESWRGQRWSEIGLF